MIADTVDAMTTDRPYRKALPFERVAEELQKHSGKQFDPRLTTILLESALIRGHVLKSQVGISTTLAGRERTPPPRRERVAV